MRALSKHLAPALKVAAAIVVVLGISEPARADKITYYHNDLLGSPVIATNETGQVIWHERYGPYGDRQLLETAGAKDKIWFTSRHEDENTELVYMGARYYDPAIGRFISIDARGFDEINIHSFNRYAYAASNPYKYRDPDGRKFEFATGSSEGFKADIALMRQYLGSNGVGGTLTEIDRRQEIIFLQQGSPGVVEYGFDTKTITIDPLAGNMVGGSVQSPALGLLHEAGHALQDLKNKKQFDADRKTADAQFGNKEERRVIEQIENPAARKLGEPTRDNHGLQYVPVKCPTCRD